MQVAGYWFLVTGNGQPATGNRFQSFHKNGKRIIARTTIITSKAARSKMINVNPLCNTLENAMFDKRINNNSCGMINGKPMIAINAALCWARAAMAAKKVNTKLKLTPPKQLMAINKNGFCNGLPNNN